MNRLRLLAISLLLLFGLPVSLHAQAPDESATDDGGSSFLDKAVRLFEDDSRTWRPVVAIVVPGAGVGAGAELQSPVSPTQPLGVGLEGVVSIYNYQQVVVRAGLLEGRRDLSALRAVDSSPTSLMDAGEPDARGTSVHIEHRYRRLPRLALFGTDETGVVRTSFGVRRDATDMVVQWKGARRWGLSGRVGTMVTTRLTEADGDQPSTEGVVARLDTGRASSVRYFTGGVGIAIDHRTTTPRTGAGWLVQGALLGFQTSDSASASFARVALDARAYQPLGVASHVLAARVLVSTDRRTDRRPVPYYLQASLGGSSSVRSYSSYRFRGDHLFNLTVESRWTVHRRFEVVPFLDVGRVWSPLQRQGPTGFITSYGLALRVRHDGKTVGRLELARGDAGTRVIFAVGSGF
jgi:hypothetical protein